MHRGVVTTAIVTACFAAPCIVSLARAQAPETASIWYRGAEGCPSGADFLVRLERRGLHARLAEVGDPIDFVVTLGDGAEGGRGLLERQTKTGTVSIRRLDGDTCDQVADGIALSLSLANTPEERLGTSPDAVVPAVEAPAPSKPGGETAKRDSAARPPVAPPVRGSRMRWSVGVQGDAVSGVAPDLLPGGALFLDFAPGNRSLPRGASIGLSGFANVRGAASGAGDYRLLLIGGRLDACPISIGTATARASPCGSFEVGALRAGGTGPWSATASGVWTALRAGVRFDVELADPVALEARLEVVAPLARYNIAVADPAETTLYRTAAVGLGIALGASFRLP